MEAQAQQVRVRWNVPLDKYYDYKEGSDLKVHIKALQKVDSGYPPMVYANVALLDEYGRYTDSKKPSYPYDSEALISIGKALMAFGEEMKEKGLK